MLNFETHTLTLHFAVLSAKEADYFLTRNMSSEDFTPKFYVSIPEE